MKPQPNKGCDSCGKPMLFSLNIDSDKTGPLDVRAVVYVVRGDINAEGKAAQTAGKFLEQCEVIRMKDGREIKPDDLAFCVSHFATCPTPGRFSRG